MNKKEVSDELINEIYNKYISGISMRKLERQYPFSFTYIQKLIKSRDHENNLLKNYPIKDGYDLVAICIKTNKIFYDYKNTSGAITNHIVSLYDIEIPSRYKRKSIEYDTGKFWYDQYFKFEYKQNPEIKKCVYCDWFTHDINNESGAYEKHIKGVHDMSLSEHLKKYPNDTKYFKKEIYDDLVKCEICGESFKYITNTHLKKHNVTQLEYKIKYGQDLISDGTKNKLTNNYHQFLKNAPYIKTSSIEKLIINEIPLNFTQSNRTILNGKEIDLLFNDIGIELNGCIYHTENFGKKDRNYHLNKSKTALDKNIKLYHIFEDEIHSKPDIVLNKLRHILKYKSNHNIIHARKTIISENITHEEKSKFLNNNHIQGNDKSKINVVARYGDDIIGIMTFDNKRYMNKSQNHSHKVYELSRFCVKNDVISNGLASKLLKYFILNYNPNTIISFADRRWTPDPNNNLYTKLKFDLVKTLPPNYWYYNPKIDRVKRFHKFGFGKNNLKKRFPEVYDHNKSEWEMMQELGYDRIWDCGKFKYELNLKGTD